MRVGKRWLRGLGAVILTAATLVAVATPAAANHSVTWGAGTACDAVSKAASTNVDQPVRFVVCVILGGQPLPGHAMDLRVTGPTRSSTARVVTDDSGTARFSVQPTAAGETRVQLCDADGCLYGETVLTVTPAPTSTTAPPDEGSSTTAAGGVVATSSTLEFRPVDTDDDSGSSLPWVLLMVLILLLGGLGVWLLGRGGGGGGIAVDGGGDDEDPRDDDLTLYGEEIDRTLHNDALHMTNWKLHLKSESETRWAEPWQGNDGYVLRRTDRPTLWALIEIRDAQGRRVGLRLFKFDPDAQDEDTGAGRGIVQTVHWEHSAQQQHNWPEYQQVLENPDGPRTRQVPPPAKVSHEHDFGIVVRQKDEPLALGHTARESWTYRLIDCFIQLVPKVDAEDKALGVFDRSFSTDSLANLVDSAIDDVGAAVAGATGPFERVTQAVIDKLKEQWKESGGKAATVFARLPRHLLGKDETNEIPISSAEHSAEDATVGAAPELWAVGSEVDTQLEVLSGAFRLPDLPLRLTVRGEARFLVRRDGDVDPM